MTDDELIGYTDLHSRTDVAEFSGEYVNRLRVMAGMKPRTYGPKQYVVLDQADWLPLREMIMRRRELLAISKKLTRPELAWVAQMKGCYVIDSGGRQRLGAQTSCGAQPAGRIPGVPPRIGGRGEAHLPGIRGGCGRGGAVLRERREKAWGGGVTNFQRWRKFFELSWICGRHSGIPWHCIIWYATGDWWFRAPPWYRVWATSRVGPRYGYIPCPICALIRRKPNTVFRCSDSCARKLWLRAYRAKKARNLRP